MKLNDVWNNNINVNDLPDDLHKELTVKKLANELIRIATVLDCLTQSNDINEIKQNIIPIKMRCIKLVASMIHLFEWIDEGDIIYQNQLRALSEEYLWRLDTATHKTTCPECGLTHGGKQSINDITFDKLESVKIKTDDGKIIGLDDTYDTDNNSRGK